MASTKSTYKLGGSLAGHTADVRVVLALPTGHIVSGSRDTHVLIWAPESVAGGPTTWTICARLTAHSHFVGALSYDPVTKTLISASNDKTAIAWDLSGEPSTWEKSTPLLTLIGHSESVVALSVIPAGAGGSAVPTTAANLGIVTGSWDKTARMWTGATCTAELKGHQATVWAVLARADGSVLTGSADKTIRVWKGGSTIATINGHTDCVRAIVPDPVLGGFVSVGNDAIVRQWTANGEPIGAMEGHEAFAYTLAVSPSGTDYVSGGEDKTAKVWSQSALQQSLNHPSVVWSVAVLPNSDVVVGCSDGWIRVWTKDPARVVSEDELKAYDENLAAQTISAKTLPNGARIEDLPAADALDVPGKKDGETKMVNNNGTPEVHTWSAAESKWNMVGTIVDGPSGSKQELYGVKYDYVFDVDIGDGNIRKLGYNAGENPWTSAQEFLWREELPQDFLQQVAEFIQANAGAAATIGGGAAGSRSADPFTSSGAYVPGTAPPPVAPPPSALQVEGGYVSAAARGGALPQAPAAPTPAVPRPPSTHQSGTPPVPPPPATASAVVGGGKWVPKTGAMLSYDTGNLDGAMTKITQFSGELGGDSALTAGEEAAIGSMIETLKASSRYHVTNFSAAEYAALDKIMGWPLAQRFPVLDLARMLVTHPEGAAHYGASGELLERVLASGIGNDTPIHAMLALRFLVNAFKPDYFWAKLAAKRSDILDTVAGVVDSPKPNVRLALASLLLNYSVLFLSHAKGDAEGKIQAASLVVELLNKETEDQNKLQALAALGTLLWKDDALKEVADGLDVKAAVAHALNGASADVKEAAAEVQALL